MAAIDPLEMARHINRVRRRQITTRDGVVTREIPGGWLSARPGAEPGEYPSASVNRVYWLTVERPVADAEAGAALDSARSLGCRRLYLWLAPWGWDAGTEMALRGAGAEPWPWVEYIGLARAARECVPERPTALEVRAVAGDEAARVLAAARPWFGKDGTPPTMAEVDEGAAVHAAFDAGVPVALGLVSMDGDWAYLGAARTSPEHRGRGGQSALICSRVRAAAAAGAKWCASETNTTVPISLRNLRRCGFEDVIRWRVYRWDDKGHGA